MYIEPEVIAIASVNKMAGDDDAWDSLSTEERDVWVEVVTYATAYTLNLVRAAFAKQGLNMTIEVTEDEPTT